MILRAANERMRNGLLSRNCEQFTQISVQPKLGANIPHIIRQFVLLRAVNDFILTLLNSKLDRFQQEEEELWKRVNKPFGAVFVE